MKKKNKDEVLPLVQVTKKVTEYTVRLSTKEAQWLCTVLGASSGKDLYELYTTLDEVLAANGDGVHFDDENPLEFFAQEFP
jgi:hypothetical protein